jgi:hypothetical protein
VTTTKTPTSAKPKPVFSLEAKRRELERLRRRAARLEREISDHVQASLRRLNLDCYLLTGAGDLRREVADFLDGGRR